MALAPAPRASSSKLNVSVGLLMLLLVGSLLLYRLGTQAVPAYEADLAPPVQLWTVPLLSEARGAATAGSYSFVLTKDRLGMSALMIIDDQGLLVRTESLGSTGVYTLASSPLGVLCVARDQGSVSLYGADSRRRWTAHLPGPITATAADESGAAAAFGPKLGATAGDGVAPLTPGGAAGRAVTFPYGAVTALELGPQHSLAAAVFTADPRKAPEALVFIQQDGTSVPVAGAGLGAARIAATGESYFVGTARSVSAYDSCGQRRWTVRAPATRAIAARDGRVVAASADRLTAYASDSGKRLWQLRLAAPPDALAEDADGVVAATSEGLVAVDWQGKARWLVADAGLGWDLGDGVLIVIQRETAVAYRTR